MPNGSTRITRERRMAPRATAPAFRRMKWVKWVKHSVKHRYLNSPVFSEPLLFRSHSSPCTPCASVLTNVPLAWPIRSWDVGNAQTIHSRAARQAETQWSTKRRDFLRAKHIDSICSSKGSFSAAYGIFHFLQKGFERLTALLHSTEASLEPKKSNASSSRP